MRSGAHELNRKVLVVGGSRRECTADKQTVPYPLNGKPQPEVLAAFLLVDSASSPTKSSQPREM